MCEHEYFQQNVAQYYWGPVVKRYPAGYINILSERIEHCREKLKPIVWLFKNLIDKKNFLSSHAIYFTIPYLKELEVIIILIKYIIVWGFVCIFF